jgi:hypothetical protein
MIVIVALLPAWLAVLAGDNAIGAPTILIASSEWSSGNDSQRVQKLHT